MSFCDTGDDLLNFIFERKIFLEHRVFLCALCGLIHNYTIILYWWQSKTAFFLIIPLIHVKINTMLVKPIHFFQGRS